MLNLFVHLVLQSMESTTPGVGCSKHLTGPNFGAQRKTAPELLKSHCQHVNKDLVGLVGRSVLFTVDGARLAVSPRL